MNTLDELVFSDEEKEILQEVMNIAFGQASADLAEVIDIFVVLNVPYIQVVKAAELREYIVNEIKDFQSINIVEQSYLGRFKGSALLVFPTEASREIVSLLEQDSESVTESIAVLEKETLIEVGNILIGACVGKVAELLNDIVTYSPPRIAIKNSPEKAIPENLIGPDSMGIVMKTVFSFENRDVSGLLFLISNPESIQWLQKALHTFLEQYE